jgi:hypothetical protein
VTATKEYVADAPIDLGGKVAGESRTVHYDEGDAVDVSRLKAKEVDALVDSGLIREGKPSATTPRAAPGRLVLSDDELRALDTDVLAAAGNVESWWMSVADNLGGLRSMLRWRARSLHGDEGRVSTDVELALAWINDRARSALTGEYPTDPRKLGDVLALPIEPKEESAS